MRAVDAADDVPGALAVEEIPELHGSAGQHLLRHFAECLHGPGIRRALAEGVQQALHQRLALRVAPARGRLRVPVGLLMQEMLLEMHHVVGQRVLEAAVVLAPAAQEDDGEAVLGVGADDLVDPARHPAAHVGERALQHQGDVGRLCLGVVHGRWLQ